MRLRRAAIVASFITGVFVLWHAATNTPLEQWSMLGVAGVLIAGTVARATDRL